MGRRKTYDRDEIAERAMRLFWEQGFHATSTRDLTDAMGVNPYSLYAEFGSKEGVYSAALERYDEIVVTRHFGPLEGPDAGLAEARAVVDFFGDAGERAASERGCLMCNASTERAPTIAGSIASTGRFVERVTGAFANALGNAVARGELPAGTPVDGLAAVLTTHIVGTCTLMRSQANGAVLRMAADRALACLDAAAAGREG